MSSYWTYVGTYTDQDSNGIYRGRLDESTGTLSDMRLAAKTENPSFMAAGPSGEILYTVNELEEGTVTAFRITGDGSLKELDRRVIGPADPCHCSVDPTSKYLFVAHYTGGVISVLPLNDDGTLGDPTIVEHEGSSIHQERQTSPHPHSVTVSPNNKFLYAPDLGTDEVVVYKINRKMGKLEHLSSVQIHDGAGPRHLTFHDGEAYLINELDSTLSRLLWDPNSGSLEEATFVGTLDESYEGQNYASDIHVSPAENRIYSSNRGHDSIGIIDCSGNGLELLTTTSTYGEWPRNFILSPRGKYLFVANQHTDTVSSFEIADNGELNGTGEITDIPQPTCIVTIDEP